MLERLPIGGMRVVPQELKCVWMSAGVLTYKLCNKEFDCESCALHMALIDDMPQTNKQAETTALRKSTIFGNQD